MYQEVFHITPDSPRGFVIDIYYSYRHDKNTYRVTFSHEAASLEYEEEELSEKKRF